MPTLQVLLLSGRYRSLTEREQIALLRVQVMENRSGLVVGVTVTHTDGTGERTAALAMLDATPKHPGRTRGADKAYYTREFAAACRERGVTPHLAQNDSGRRRSAIDERTTRHDGYRLSQVVRKRIEEHFGWGKTVGRIRQAVYRGIRRVDCTSN